MRIGVYVCHCGRNIAGTVNVAAVVEFARNLPHVAVAKEYRYVCSDPGQQIISDDIAEFGLDKVVIASCSPSMHQNTFMNNVQKAGLNPYCLDRANIRENCSWVHSNMTEATEKAKLLVAAAVAKVILAEPLEVKEVSVTPAALVIGGGIAGIQAALDIGDAGFKVYLVEREPDLGGHVAQLYKTFPSLEETEQLLQSRMERIKEHPNIEVLTSSEVTGMEGYIGNFKVTVKQDGVDRELEIGTMVVATGYDTFDASLKPEFGYGVYPNVITGLELERLASPSGPTGGKIEIDGKGPANVVFIQCVGSRDKSVGVEYCSRVCCMYTAKQASYIKDKLPEARVTVCYIDIRAFGKGCEEFYEKVQREKVIYRRGNVSEVYKRGDKLVVRAEDTLLGETFEEEADLVVLATGMRPARDAALLGKMLHISSGADGFFLEAHPKLGPVETTTDGIFLAGCAVGPKDITDSISQGHAAAVKASIPLFLGRVSKEPLVAHIDEEVCAGCGLCESSCEFGALVLDTRRKVMTVNEALCRGCGACSALCPSGANQLRNTTEKQVFDMIEALL
ncbi:MAG TPA: CoB--CoM heterodisulfide reductase iron-sulfur subunit A family protein [Dehalococcoidia bacterium]|nr:CoB--CoM heterodisulfide reductase iron-sulfur subunit A family protein [Dehalococcoidia bacterium]